MKNTVKDPFEASLSDAVVFARVDVDDAIDKSGVFGIHPDDLIIRIGHEVTNSLTSGFILEMATDESDRAVPRESMCENASLLGFPLTLSSAASPDVPLSMIYIGIEERHGFLEIEVDLAFTDAEWRGEGLGKILSEAASQVIERSVEAWINIDGNAEVSRADISVSGNAVSPGGARILSSISSRIDGIFERENVANFEPV